MDIKDVTPKFAFHYDKETKWLHSGGHASKAPPGGIGKALFEKIKEHAAQGLIFQIDADSDKEETYAEFLSKCIKIALYMKDQGLKSGDKIAMCSQNNLNNVAVLIAAIFNGIILASTDPLTSLEDSKYLLDLVDAKWMFVCEDSMNIAGEAAEANGSKILTLYEHCNFDNVPDILKKYNDEDTELFVPYYAEDLNETINLGFSSGTTGLPKASCLNHHMFWEEVPKTVLPPGTRVIAINTLYWSSCIGVVYGILRFGCIRIAIRNCTPENMWEYIGETKCAFAFIPYGLIIQSMPYINRPLPNLAIVLTTGGLLPAIFQEQLKEKIPHLRLTKSYGLTEIGIVAINPGLSPPESAGQIYPTEIILKIVDIDTDQAVDLNAVGEIRVKGNVQLVGYLKRGSEDIWDEEGFYKTGDVGYLNDKYELYVVDRIKEMFKYRGYHVIPEKIERVLSRHPAVKLALVIPVRHLTDDNHAKAVVVLKDGCDVSQEELLKFTNDNVEDPRDHIRAGVELIADADVPYNTTNKINRRVLKETYGK